MTVSITRRNAHSADILEGIEQEFDGIKENTEDVIVELRADINHLRQHFWNATFNETQNFPLRRKVGWVALSVTGEDVTYSTIFSFNILPDSGNLVALSMDPDDIGLNVYLNPDKVTANPTTASLYQEQINVYLVGVPISDTEANYSLFIHTGLTQPTDRSVSLTFF